MCMNTIYKVTCLSNQKVYIGFTTRSVQERLQEHLKGASNTTDLRKFYCAIRKYGNHKFVINVIYQSSDYIHTLEVMEQYFIEEYNSIKYGYNSRLGGTGFKSTRKLKPVDIYDRNGTFIRTFSKMKDCAKFLNVPASRVSSACSNANKNISSQINGYWVCHTSSKPVYKVPNSAPGCEAARLANTGKKRNKHSEHMKTRARKHNNKVHIPEGWFILEDAKKYYGTDMLREWCYNPDKIITKMMITKSKKLNDYSLVGKSRREAGFYANFNSL